jgi:hypothetical protein
VALGLLGGLATPATHAQATVPAAHFGNPISIAVPVLPGNTLGPMATGDVNRDGTPDLIVASSLNGGSNPGVYVILGKNQNGSLSFVSSTFVAVGSPDVNPGPILGLTVADVNGDGSPDIVTANAYQGDAFGTQGPIITVATGDGKGNFWYSNQQSYMMDLPGLNDYSGTASVVVSDVDGSGKPEIIVGSAAEVDVWRSWSDWYGTHWEIAGHYNPPSNPPRGDHHGGGRGRRQW